MLLSCARLASRGTWEIAASVVMSRPALIAPPPSSIETRFQQLRVQHEHEQSLLSDFELKTIQDEKLLARRAELEREGKELSELDGEMGVTNAMLIDEWSKKADMLTKSCQLGNPTVWAEEGRTSLRRALDRRLVLLVKQRFGQAGYESPWILPQLMNKQGETLRQTAERCIGEVAGGDVNVQLLGDAPFAVHTHRYPKALREKKGGVEGAKIFFYQAVLQNNEFPINTDEVVEHQWATEQEFWSTVPSRKYKTSVRTAFLE